MTCSYLWEGWPNLYPALFSSCIFCTNFLAGRRHPLEFRAKRRRASQRSLSRHFSHTPFRQQATGLCATFSCSFLCFAMTLMLKGSIQHANETDTTAAASARMSTSRTALAQAIRSDLRTLGSFVRRLILRAPALITACVETDGSE